MKGDTGSLTAVIIPPYVMARLKESMKNVIKDSRYPSRDSNCLPVAPNCVCPI